MPKNKIQTTVLIILDGWGIANAKNFGNAITPETAPNYFDWLKKYPHGELAASGTAVGLLKGQEGNSEAGHLNLGAGRVVKQDALYIYDAIEDGTFFKNNAFFQAIRHIKKYGASAHVMGLLSNHNSAHSCPEHLHALLDFLNKNGIKKVYLHLFTDGRDSGQHDAPQHLKKLEKHLHGNEKIATVMGRFYSMDRNKDWERTKRAYEAMVRGKGCGAKSAEEAITQAYNRGETDEFICPTIIKKDGGPTAVIKDNDAIFFFNLRSDRARQITKTFVQPNFKEANQDSFHRVDLPKNIRFVAMTDFGPDLPNILTAFPSRDVENSLTQILCPRRQMYIAESEKFAHITYFFNGGYAQHFCDERWVKISSLEVTSYEEKPKMSAKKIADYAISGIESGEYEFIAINFANPDMVGHTGNLKSGKIAVNEVDAQAERVLKSILKTGAQAIITADHGNVEEMINLKTKEIDTEHSVNPVPYFIVSSRLNMAKKLRSGKLADVAPMILKMMNMPKPKEMTGNSLF